MVEKGAKKTCILLFDQHELSKNDCKKSKYDWLSILNGAQSLYLCIVVNMVLLVQFASNNNELALKWLQCSGQCSWVARGTRCTHAPIITQLWDHPRNLFHIEPKTQDSAEGEASSKPTGGVTMTLLIFKCRRYIWTGSQQV